MDRQALAGKKILITAGPTREAIDPVRYISNHSSGKMGYAIAAECLAKGASVILVSGPVCCTLEHKRLQIEKVNTASEMYLACCRHFEEADVVIFAAAVADYRPAKPAAHKLKKEENELTIRLVKNVDIAFEFGKLKQPKQLSVGFALETNDETLHATGKLLKKNFDLIILNSMNDSQATFGFDTNKISIIRKDLSRVDHPLKTKTMVAADIVQEISNQLQSRLQLAEEESVEMYESMYQ